MLAKCEGHVDNVLALKEDLSQGGLLGKQMIKVILVGGSGEEDVE